MLSKLPAVCHAGLQHRSPGNLALHLHFARELETKDQGTVLARLGDYVLQQQGPVLTPEFKGAVVLLRPIQKSQLDYEDYRDIARHFGYVPPDGDLPFLGQGQCPIITEDEDDRPIYIGLVDLLKH